MDIKEKLEEIVKKIVSNPALLAKFRSDPAAVIKELTGLEVTNDQLKMVTAAVEARVGAGTVRNALGGLFGRK